MALQLAWNIDRLPGVLGENLWANLILLGVTLVTSYAIFQFLPPRSWREAAIAFGVSLASMWLAASLFVAFTPGGEFLDFSPRFVLDSATNNTWVFSAVFQFMGAVILGAATAIVLLSALGQGGGNTIRPLRPPPRGLTIVLLLGLVVLSTTLGLLSVILEGFENFTRVWGANFFGDLTFILGTMAAAAAAWWVMSRLARFGLYVAGSAAAAIGFLLHWAVYVASWGFTSVGYFSHLDPQASNMFWSLKWQFETQVGGEGGMHALFVTYNWGLLGILGMALAVPILTGWLATRHTHAEPTPLPSTIRS